MFTSLLFCFIYFVSPFYVNKNVSVQLFVAHKFGGVSFLSVHFVKSNNIQHHLFRKSRIQDSVLLSTSYKFLLTDSNIFRVT
ncbi:hypothetical protein C1645_838072 [Glomus cerebriforme]|uniref:Secreted protein n=1 Tax=Glomus cerebriforme TaxID=658196 RepID=A0A397S456_9GLOM|nr:hypothetical protein C1645_838072 [Glomus cerebriforme]